MRLLLLATLLLAGCRSSYDGPSFAGDWATAPIASRVMTLSLTQDLGAVLDLPVRGDLVDARGARWTLRGEPEREGAQGVVRSDGGLRVGLRDPLTLLTDQGEALEFPEGPIHWTLVRGALPDGSDAITLHFAAGGRFVWSPSLHQRHHCTFRRATAPAPTPEPSALAATCTCGQELRPEWRHCPACGAPVR